MSQLFICEMRVNKIIFFPARDEMSAKTVIEGYTTGLDAYYATVEVFGAQAEHTDNFLKKGSLISIAGTIQVKSKTDSQTGSTQYFTVVKAIRPVEFISGIKNEIERIDLARPETFKNKKEAKDAVAGVVQGFGVDVLPIQNLGFMAMLVDRRKDEKLAPIYNWIVDLAKHFND